MLVVTGLTFSLSLLASGGPALRTGPGEGERTHYTSLSTPLAGQGQLAGCQALQGEAAAAHTPDIPASPHHSLAAPAQSYILQPLSDESCSLLLSHHVPASANTVCM